MRAAAGAGNCLYRTAGLGDVAFAGASVLEPFSEPSSGTDATEIDYVRKQSAAPFGLLLSYIYEFNFTARRRNYIAERSADYQSLRVTVHPATLNLPLIKAQMFTALARNKTVLQPADIYPVDCGTSWDCASFPFHPEVIGLTAF